jgi:hypothetical protein
VKIKDLLDYCRDRDQSINQTLGDFTNQLHQFVGEALESKKRVKILKSLHFKQIKERQSDIPVAHKNTFDWIFNLGSNITFAHWLRYSDGIYWVAGKAGSGKSTLMKFIQGHPKTRKILQMWAGGQDLVIGTHYFWSAGTPLQKTQAGLFRTLLFQILAQCPQYIPKVLPDRWRGISFAYDESWTRAELFTAFEKLSTLPELTEKICLFVDGLDEYSGDHPELIKTFQVLSKSSNIKICVSSRPWQNFVDAFDSSSWKLYVQDLTKKDIQLYVKDNLERDPTFQNMGSRDEEGADALVQQIQSKANGVFLWVYLVVRSLLRGLVNSDQMADLHARIDELPTELEKYFELMLNTIEPIYRQQTARVFNVMLASASTLPVILFHFIGKQRLEPTYAIHGDIETLLPYQVEAMIDQQRRQLNASCRDLLFITKDRNENAFLSVAVSFLHRTVVDFLRTSQMEELLNAKAGTEFNPISSLCQAYWAMFKAAPSDGQAIVFGETTRGIMVSHTLYYAKEAEKRSECPEIDILDDVARELPRQTPWIGLLKDWNEKPTSSRVVS